MPHHHAASCCCGQLKLTYDGEITKSSICHCFACQMRTGSVFGAQTRLERAKATIEGRSTIYERTGDDPLDGSVKFHFCPTCGSTVFWELSGMTESVIAAVGAFQNPQFPPPTFSVYEARKHAWVTVPDSVTEHWD
ncbi:MAG: GFA family protein [Bdellovibrionota bacterium]